MSSRAFVLCDLGGFVTDNRCIFDPSGAVMLKDTDFGSIKSKGDVISTFEGIRHLDDDGDG